MSQDLLKTQAEQISALRGQRDAADVMQRAARGPLE